MFRCKLHLISLFLHIFLLVFTIIFVTHAPFFNLHFYNMHRSTKTNSMCAKTFTINCILIKNVELEEIWKRRQEQRQEASKPDSVI